jgi:hypothetical protein
MSEHERMGLRYALRRIGELVTSRCLLLLFLPSLFAMSCAYGADGYHTHGFEVDGMSCEHGDPLRRHAHVHLSVFAEGQTVPVPEYVGLDGECLMPLHTYDGTGVIHLETATERDFSLGNFFAIWHQPLSTSILMNFKADGTHQIRASVNGQPFDGDPSKIPLSGHADIVLAYGPPFPTPEPFQFPASAP